MHARMAECVNNQDACGLWEPGKAVPMPTASLGNSRSAGLRTLELEQECSDSSPSQALRPSG